MGSTCPNGTDAESCALLREELNAKHQKIQRLETEIKELKVKLSQTSPLEGTIQLLKSIDESDIDDIGQQLTQAHELEKRLETSHAQDVKLIEQLRNSIVGLEKSNTQLELQKAEYQFQAEELQGEVKALTANVDAAEKMRAKLQQEAEELQQSQEDWEEQAGKQEEETHSMHSIQIEELNSKVRELETTHHMEMQELQDKMLSEKEEALLQLTSELNKQFISRAQVAAEKAKTEASQRHQEELEAVHSNHAAELHAVKAYSEQLQAQLTEKLEEVMKLHKDHQDEELQAKRQKERFDAEAAALRDIVTQRTTELEEVKEELELSQQSSRAISEVSMSENEAADDEDKQQKRQMSGDSAVMKAILLEEYHQKCEEIAQKQHKMDELEKCYVSMITDLTTEVEKLKMDGSTSEEAANAAMHDIQRLSDENHQLEQLLSLHTTRIEEGQASLNQLQGELRESERQQAMLTEQLQLHQAQHTEERNRLIESAEQNGQEASQHKATIIELQDKLQLAQSQLSDSHLHIDQLKLEQSEWAAQKSHLEDSMKHLLEEVEAQNGQKTTLELQLDDLQYKKSESEQQAQTTTNEVTALKQQVAALKEEIEELVSQISTDIAEKVEIQEQFDEKNKLCHALQEQVSVLEEENQVLLSEVKNLQTETLDSADNVASLQDTLISHRDSSTKTIASLEKERNQLQQDKAALEDGIHLSRTQENTSKQLEGQASDQPQPTVDQLTRTCEKLEEKLIKLNSKYKKAKVKLRSLQAQLDDAQAVAQYKEKQLRQDVERLQNSNCLSIQQAKGLLSKYTQKHNAKQEALMKKMQANMTAELKAMENFVGQVVDDVESKYSNDNDDDDARSTRSSICSNSSLGSLPTGRRSGLPPPSPASSYGSSDEDTLFDRPPPTPPTGRSPSPTNSLRSARSGQSPRTQTPRTPH